MAINLYLSFQKLAFGLPIGSRPMLLLGVLLLFTGFQFISLGLLGEMQARIYHESQQKPIYSVRRILGEKRAGVPGRADFEKSTITWGVA